VVDLIYKIVFLSLINKRKGKDSFYLSEISEEFDLDVVEVKKTISYK